MLTVLIICKNERANIAACAESARPVADELLVADSGSSDGTLEIARALGCRVIEREYRTYGDFKRWAIPHANHEWVLVLDADERVTPELVSEIRKVFSTQPQVDGFWLRRLNHFFSRPILHGDWGHDYMLRLFRRDKVHCDPRTDHADVRVTTGRVGRLHAPFIHYPIVSYPQYLSKLYRYASVQAELWHAEGRRASYWQLLMRGPLRFLRTYLLRLGFLDGTAGLQCSILIGYGAFLKQARLWELEQEGLAIGKKAPPDRRLAAIKAA